MSAIPTAPATTHTLAVADADLYYERRGAGPLMVLIGDPMDAGPFGPLAEALADGFTVITTDPRGINRSRLHDPEQDSTPELRARALAGIIDHLDLGPATVFGSSGGAVTTLALVASRPELVRTAIAHEPPLTSLLEDRDEQRAREKELVATYLGGDVMGAWARFFDLAGMQMPDEVLQQMFGGERDPQAVADERYFFAHAIHHTTGWQPHLDALRGASSRIVVGIGADSTGQLCDRTSRALAAGLGLEPVSFPGGHGGFMEAPAAFAARLRSIVAGT
jgi:pimeloyl-ACP methyl ester carboxylesterase